MPLNRFAPPVIVNVPVPAELEKPIVFPVTCMLFALVELLMLIPRISAPVVQVRVAV